MTKLKVLSISTIFTSGTQARDGRTVNHDPRPWRDIVGNERFPWEVDYSRYEPRPEFDVLDNPILADFRADRHYSTPDRAASYLIYLRQHPKHVGQYYEPEHVEHARRVLSKLAALS